MCAVNTKNLSEQSSRISTIITDENIDSKYCDNELESEYDTDQPQIRSRLLQSKRVQVNKTRELNKKRESKKKRELNTTSTDTTTPNKMQKLSNKEYKNIYK
eukprot:173648_1